MGPLGPRGGRLPRAEAGCGDPGRRRRPAPSALGRGGLRRSDVRLLPDHLHRGAPVGTRSSGAWAGWPSRSPTMSGTASSGAFLSEAVIGGVGSVLVFVPQVALLFPRSSPSSRAWGYGAGGIPHGPHHGRDGTGQAGLRRHALLLRLRRPGIMATRTIGSSKTRIATILAAPLMPCSARLPVYVLLVGLLVPSGTRWGPVQARVWRCSPLRPSVGCRDGLRRVLRSTVLRGELVPFYLEMPPLPDAPAALGAALLVELGADVPPQRPGRSSSAPPSSSGRCSPSPPATPRPSAWTRRTPAPTSLSTFMPPSSAGPSSRSSSRRLRLADRPRPGRRGLRAGGLRLHPRPGLGGYRPGGPVRGAGRGDLSRRAAGREPLLLRPDRGRPARVVCLCPPVHVHGRGDAPRDRVGAGPPWPSPISPSSRMPQPGSPGSSPLR